MERVRVALVVRAQVRVELVARDFRPVTARSARQPRQEKELGVGVVHGPEDARALEVAVHRGERPGLGASGTRLPRALCPMEDEFYAARGFITDAVDYYFNTLHSFASTNWHVVQANFLITPIYSLPFGCDKNVQLKHLTRNMDQRMRETSLIKV